MIINSRTISSLLLTALLLFSSIPLAFGGSADTSVSVLNAKPQFLRYWIDGQGPVEYVSDGRFSGDTQTGDFYFMTDPTSENPIPHNPAYNTDPSRFIIDIEPPVNDYRDVEIKVEIQDANGYDDLTGSEVSALMNADNIEWSAPPAIVLTFDTSPSVDSAIYNGTFRLYKETAAGRWVIKFQFRDFDKGIGWYHTNFGGFYANEVIAISLYDSESESADPASTFSFGNINPGESGESTMHVQNDGNTNLRIDVTPEDMAGTGGSTDILDPVTSSTKNSDNTDGGAGFFNVEQPTPVNWNIFTYHRGMAIYGVDVPTGTQADTYTGVIVVEPTPI